MPGDAAHAQHHRQAPGVHRHDLTADGQGGSRSLGSASAGFFGGRYDGDVLLDARPAQAQLSLNEHIRGVDIGALMKALFATSRLVDAGTPTWWPRARKQDAALFPLASGQAGRQREKRGARMESISGMSCGWRRHC